MGRRSMPYPRRSARAASRWLAGVVAGLVMAVGGTALAATTVDLTTVGATGSLNDGAVIQQSFAGVVGTGVLEPFLRVQRSGNEEGYNTSSRLAGSNKILWADGSAAGDVKTDPATHDLALNTVPVVVYNGQPYREFRLDLNEDSGSGALVSLDEVRVFVGTDQNINYFNRANGSHRVPPSATVNAATPVWEMGDFTVKLNADLSSGSGNAGDARLLVPVGAFGTAGTACPYNPAAAPCGYWVYFYTQFGLNQPTEATFEEWSVRKVPYATKTATTSYTRTYQWDITKSVSPSIWNLFTGESGTSRYTVAVTRTGYVDSNITVSGSIQIFNPTGDPITITSVTDVPQGGSATVTCPSAYPFQIAKNSSVTCTYTGTVPTTAGGVNSATIAFTGAAGNESVQATAPFTFGAPATVVNGTVNVTDTVAGSLGSFSNSGSVSYTDTFTCDGDEGTHVNTATIAETGQSSSASVTVNCFTLSVAKNAATTYTRTFQWTIDKSADQTEFTVNPGQSVDVHYTVTVDTTGYTDSNWAVAGSITVTNPAPKAAVINTVADVVSPAIAASVNCGVTFPYTLAAGGTLTCSYSAALPDATSRTNTATASQQLYDYDPSLTATPAGTAGHTGSAAVAFGAPTTVVDEQITVTDTYAGALGTANALTDTLPKSFTYTRTVSYGHFPTCGDFTLDNTATFTTNDSGTTGSDSWSVLVHVPCLEGCTPGFWQGGSGLQLWDGIAPDAPWAPFKSSDRFDSFFTDPGDHFGTRTMLDVVGSGGGSLFIDKAARSLVAAYLNASDPEINYPYSTATILADWATATTANTEAAYKVFQDKYGPANELGCDRT